MRTVVGWQQNPILPHPLLRLTPACHPEITPLYQVASAHSMLAMWALVWLGGHLWKAVSNVTPPTHTHKHHHHGVPLTPPTVWIQWISPIQCMGSHPKGLAEALFLCFNQIDKVTE